VEGKISLCGMFSALDVMLRNCEFPLNIYQTKSIRYWRGWKSNDYWDYLWPVYALCQWTEVKDRQLPSQVHITQLRISLFDVVAFRDDFMSFFILHPTLCFYFPLFPSRSSTRCASVLYSHSLRIIIIHIFFRFLINSVHKSVKNHHSEALDWRRNVKKKNVKQFFNNTTFGALISRECIHICVTSALGNAR
jgi:hypothetical protein